VLRASRERDGTVVVWTLDEPDTKNALDLATIGALTDAAREAAGDGNVRAAVLTGGGSTFVSGGDLRELRHRSSAEDAELLTDAGSTLTSTLAGLPFPVIAALPGPAIGGGAELAVACDMRVAATGACIAFKQVRMGVSSAWGSAGRLATLVGAGTAARLLYSGCEIAATEAKLVGLVDEVTPDGAALATALEWASEVTLASPTAVAKMKVLLRASLEGEGDLRALERRLFVETWSGADHREAVEAWFERRRPRWQPRS
jgi:enoyl-CoA hydratase